MEEKNPQQFVQELYSKYGIEADEQGLQSASQFFEKDFDKALNSFYTQFEIDKKPSPEVLEKVKQQYNFIKPEVPVEQVSSGMDIVDNLKKAVPAAIEGVGSILKVFPTAVERQMRDLGLDKAADAFSFLSANPKDKFDMIRKGEFSIESEFAESMQSITDKMKDTKPVQGFSEAFDSKDIGNITLMALGNAANFIPSLTVGAAVGLGTGGNPVAGTAAFASMFAGQEMASAAEAIAEESGRTIAEVIKDRDEKTLVPVAIGMGAGVLENFGFKLFKGMFTSFLKKDAVKSLMATGANLAFQPLANTLETTASVYNEAYARTNSHDEAAEMAQSFLDEEGMEVAKGTLAGTLVMAGFGKAGTSSFNIAKDYVAKKRGTTATQDKDIIQKVEEEKVKVASEQENIQQKVDDEIAKFDDSELAAEVDSVIKEFIPIKAEDAASEKSEELTKETAAQNQKEESAELIIKVPEKTSGDEGVTTSIKDLPTLRTALNEFYGFDKDNTEQQDQVDKIARVVDKIAANRAKKQGVSKGDWYQSRIRQVEASSPSESTEESAPRAQVEFLEDGAAIIRAVQSPDTTSFIHEFSHVLRRDLDTSEMDALNKEFGIEKEGSWSRESEEKFANAFESYIAEGKLPDSIQDKKVLSAFEKLAEWFRDIHQSIQDVYKIEDISPRLREVINNIVEGKQLEQALDAEARSEGIIEANVSRDTTVEEGSEGVKGVEETVVSQEDIDWYRKLSYEDKQNEKFLREDNLKRRREELKNTSIEKESEYKLVQDSVSEAEAELKNLNEIAEATTNYVDKEFEENEQKAKKSDRKSSKTGVKETVAERTSSKKEGVKPKVISEKGKAKIFERPEMESPVYVSRDSNNKDVYLQKYEGDGVNFSGWYEVIKNKDGVWDSKGNVIGDTKKEALDSISKREDSSKLDNTLDQAAASSKSNKSQASNPTSKTRKDLLEDIRKAVEGRFTTVTGYNSVIANINKKLKEAGIKPITANEKSSILKNTEAGAVATIEGIFRAQGTKIPTNYLKAVMDSLKASEADREQALIRQDELNEKADLEGLTAEEEKELMRLPLVGIINASLTEKQSGIKKARDIAKQDKSDVYFRRAKASDQKAMIEAEMSLESIFGLKPDEKGYYKFDIDDVRRTFDKVRIFNPNEQYDEGDHVYRRGNVYEAKSDSEGNSYPAGNFSLSRFEKVGGASINMSRSEFQKKRASAGVFKRLYELGAKWGLELDRLETFVDKLAIRDKDNQAFQSKLVKWVSKEFRQNAQINKDKFITEDRARLMGALQKAFGTKNEKETLKKVKDFRETELTLKYQDENGSPLETTYTKAEVMYKYALMQQESAQPTFEEMSNSKKYDVATDAGWNESKAEAVRNAMDSEMLEALDAFKENVFKPIAERLNSAYKEHNGHDMVIEDDYIPWERQVSRGESLENAFLFDGTGDYQNMVRAVTNSNTITRTRSKSPFKTLDIFETTAKYINNANHYATHLKPVSMLSNMIQRGPQAAWIKAVYGDSFTKAADKLIANVATGKAAGYQRAALFDYARTGLVVGALGGNLTLIPKQLVSFPAFADSMDGGKWTAMMATAPVRMATGKWFQSYRDMMATDFIQNRLGKTLASDYDLSDSFIGNVENNLGKSKGALNSLKNQVNFAKIVSALMMPTKFGDVGAIVLGGEPLWTSTYDAAIKDGKTREQALSLAADKLTEAASRTQQSAFIMDRPIIATRSSLNSLLITFMSTPLLYGQMTAAAVRDVTHGRGSRVKAVKRALLFSYVLPSLFYTVSAGSLGLITGDEDDPRYSPENTMSRNLAVMFMGFIQHIPIVYPLVQNMLDRAFYGNKFRASAIPTISRIEKGTEKIGNTIANIKDGNGITDDDVVGLLREVAQLSGANVNAAENLLENWGDLLEGSDEDGLTQMLLGLGYSKEALGIRGYGDKRRASQAAPAPVKGRRTTERSRSKRREINRRQ